MSRACTVVGAGIGGLAAALALARAGWSVTVLEQAPEIAEVGAGLQVSPNGAAVLRVLGLGGPLDAAGVAGEAVRLIDGRGGRTVLELDIAGRGFRFVHRADLVALLLDGARAAGVEVRTAQRVEAADLSGPRPVLRVAGQAHATDLAVGADGLRSVLREALNGAAAAVFTGQVAWRATLPCDDPAPRAEVHMGPGRHLVSYPLRGGRLRNLVAVEERSIWTEEGWYQRDEPDAVRRAFAGFSPRVRGWLDRVDGVHLWGLFRHPVAARWQGGRAAILGDAAHPTLPFLAQGANMALEDAWVLAACLGRGAEVDAGLRAYQAARAARCSRIVAAAARNARLYHLHRPWSDLAHAGLRLGARLAPDAPLRRFDWLYRHDVTVGSGL